MTTETKDPVRIERFDHAGVTLEILLPRSSEDLIDEGEFEADERLPYWAELWPSARALARHLLEMPAPRGHVLELGCGVGLPSLALLARGCDVRATDYYEDALHFAVANAVQNGLPPLPTNLLDWRHIPIDFGRFDLVIVADVMYERRNARALVEALPRLVATGGRAVLADPGRVYLNDFCRDLAAAGWHVGEPVFRTEPSDPASGAVSRVRLIEILPPFSDRPSAGP